MDEQKCISYLNLGLAQKRKGDYEAALQFYEKAKVFNPYNLNIYYNSAKLLCGLGRFKQALSNFLTYAHLFILNDTISINPINLIAVRDTLERINNSKVHMPSNYNFPEDWLRKLLEAEKMHLLLSDINLFFYTGFAYLVDTKIFLDSYAINNTQIMDLQNGLLGKQSNLYLKDQEYDMIFVSYGLLFMLENIDLNLILKEKVVNHYLVTKYAFKNPLSEKGIEVENFLDRNPVDKELDNLLTQLQADIKKELSIKTVFMGYNLLSKKIFDDPGMAFMGSANIGHTATFGFERSVLEDILAQNIKLFLCYVAIPIDHYDYLIEREDMLDWEFEEYLKEKYKVNIVSIGAVSHKGHKRCRTFKFLFQR